MKQFDLLESDFWGFMPIRATYELREDILEDFNRMIMQCLTDVTYAIVSKRVRKAGKVDVFYGMEMSEHFHTVQFTFRTSQRKEGNTGQFVAYCVCAVLDAIGTKSTGTVLVKDGLVDVQVSLPPSASDQIINFVKHGGNNVVDGNLEVSTRVDSL